MAKQVHLEPEAQVFADWVSQMTWSTPQAGRIAFDAMQASPAHTQPDDAGEVDEVDIEDLIIEDGPVEQVSIRILRPHNTPGVLPVIVYIHGGGWMFGNPRTHDRLIRALVTGTQAALVFPNYTPAPEAQYPTAIEECYATTKWVADFGAVFGLDSERIAMAGDDVGGNMAAAITLMTRERGGPALHSQLLICPITDAGQDTPSYHQFAEGYHLRGDAMKWFWDHYTLNPIERQEITASPLQASIEQLNDLPPALVITAEADVLRDEGEAYAAKLRQAGVPVTAVRFLGTIHDFAVLTALANSAAARSAIALASTWLRGQFAAR